MIFSCSDDNGFTLVELMIVVAVIAILAAVALPQFQLYRTDAFNSAAQSDLKNTGRLQVSMFEASRQFGVTTNTGASVAVLGNGVVLRGPIAANDGIASQSLFYPAGLSRSVELISNCDVSGQSYVLLVKHVYGTKLYGVDSDSTTMNFQDAASGAGINATGVSPSSVPNSPDLIGGLWFSL